MTGVFNAKYYDYDTLKTSIKRKSDLSHSTRTTLLFVNSIGHVPSRGSGFFQI